MKVTVQSKIAELESRIAFLERVTGTTSEGAACKRANNTEFTNHWENLWKEFDLAIKSFFGGSA